VDQVLLTVFRAPRSYTGEDMVEVSCHGGRIAADRTMDLLLRSGCRLARPGEFTRRAVLNGKLTLAQAEAVGDLVRARTPAAYDDALGRYRGRSSPQSGQLARLQTLHAEAEYLLGFEDNDPVRPGRLRQRIAAEVNRLNRAIAAAERTRYLHDGAVVVIVGRPNVGKSSLFNRLLESERALVSPLPGTTRDRVEAEFTLAGVPVRLVDTGGLSPAPRGLTRLSAGQTDQALARADLTIAVFDGSRPAQTADRVVVEKVRDIPTIYVINKNDRPGRLGPDFVKGPAVSVSCLTGDNIGRLRARLAYRFRSRSQPDQDPTGRRRLEALTACRDALRRALSATGLEPLAIELRSGLDELAATDGPTAPAGVLDRIFAGFCVGK
jgi:tRNA modification GTPase